MAFPYNADQVGGSTVSSLTLIRELVRLDVKVTVILHGEGPLEADCRDLNVTIVLAPALSQRPMADRADGFHFRNLLSTPKLVKILRNTKPDIVHINDLSMLRTWAPVTTICRVPMVKHWRSTFKRSVSVYAGLMASQRVIAISHYNERTLPTRIRAKTVLEWNPSDVILDDDERARAKLEVRKTLGLPAGAKLIGVFGNHSLRKRTHIIADVIAALKENGDVYGVACGKRAEPYDHLLDEKIEAYGLKNKLFKPGFVSPVTKWIAGCDLVLAPAVREPFGRSFLEAAAAGTPLIMSSDSGAADLIEHEHSGLLIDPEDLNGWVIQSSRLLKDKDFAESLILAARSSLDRFSAPSHAKRVRDLYEQLLSGGASN